MATKTQREFKRQMKELEKEGKLPPTYYARRRIAYTGGGATILTVLLILWYTGILNMVFYALVSLFSPNYYGDQQPPYVPGGPSSPEAAQISTYYEAAEGVDELINNVYLDIYKRFYDNQAVPDDIFASYRDELKSARESISTESDLLRKLSDNYMEDLDVTEDMLDFADSHKNAATAQDKRYLDTLSAKSQALSDKRLELWDDLWDAY